MAFFLFPVTNHLTATYQDTPRGAGPVRGPFLSASVA
jgi:hypothetical protein